MNQERRPRIKIERRSMDVIVDSLSFLILLAIWCGVLINYAALPETIPTHYNAQGEIDGYGAKSTLLTLPCAATVICVALYLLHNVPHWYNYTVKITPENARKEYTQATRMMRIVNLFVVIVFGFISFRVLMDSLN